MTPDQIRLRLDSILEMRGIGADSRLDILIRHVLAEVLIGQAEENARLRRALQLYAPSGGTSLPTNWRTFGPPYHEVSGGIEP